MQQISDFVEASIAGMKSARVAVALRSGAVVRMEFLPPAVRNGPL